MYVYVCALVWLSVCMSVRVSVCTELMLDQMVASGQLNTQHRETVCDVLLARHRHQHQRKEGAKGLPVIRSLADIGHRNSEKRLENRGIVCVITQLSFFLAVPYPRVVRIVDNQSPCLFVAGILKQLSQSKSSP